MGTFKARPGRKRLDGDGGNDGDEGGIAVDVCDGALEILVLDCTTESSIARGAKGLPLSLFFN